VRVWAPYAKQVHVRLRRADGSTMLTRSDDGWHTGSVPGLGHGEDYELVLDGGDPMPDPLARRLPEGVHGPARHWDPARTVWGDGGWAGRALAHATAVYELHVGTFTPEGTLDAAVERLDHLVDLGVSHVELMPLSAFDGPRGWGYDGVALAAVHEGYGGPDALCRFVDAAHRRGLAVLLDVVHNHFGPSGNYWDRCGPFMTEVHRTPWGVAVNLDAPGSDDVRAILIETALGWLRDFHLDGLRLDAVHELVDNRAVTFLEELSAGLDDLSVALGRPLPLIAESDQNDPRTITPAGHGGLGMTAQWDDDVHHALHWLVTGETAGYYADFGSAAAVAHTLEHGFLHDGRFSTFRGRTHGRPLDFAATDPWRLVVALQTHDQVGNRAMGDRLSHLTNVDRLAGAAAILLTLPYTPMLFMGEEWGAGTPWRYFTSFPDAGLGEAVTRGRRAEFAAYGWDAEDVPDPQDPATHAASTLDWSERTRDGHARLLRWYRELLTLRAHEPGLRGAAAGSATPPLRCHITEGDAGAPLTVRLARPGWTVAVNLSDRPQPVDVPEGSSVRLLWPDGAAVSVADGSVRLSGGASAVLRS